MRERVFGFRDCLSMLSLWTIPRWNIRTPMRRNTEQIIKRERFTLKLTDCIEETILSLGSILGKEIIIADLGSFAKIRVLQLSCRKKSRFNVTMVFRFWRDPLRRILSACGSMVEQ